MENELVLSREEPLLDTTYKRGIVKSIYAPR
jgi:hypothetical protein